jgi:hypothetical protein
MTISGWTLVGTGGAAVITGAILGALSSSAGKNARGSCSEVDGSRLCLIGAVNDLERERDLAIGTDVAFGVGISAAIAGTVLLLIGDGDGTF